MSDTISTLLVRVAGIPAGVLEDFGAFTRFFLLDSYLAMAARPVLGQQFEDHPERVWRYQNRVPKWFANILPEGELRKYLAGELGVSSERDAPLLAAMGGDLPGAVTVEHAETNAVKADNFDEESPVPHVDDPTGAKFSVAGHQLKMSMVLSATKGLTLAGRGQLGGHLVKLPSKGYANVPENEFVMMQWAHEVGIQTPSSFLTPTETLNLPFELGTMARQNAYVVARFDRDKNRRIHIEDLNQVLDQWPQEKYRYHSYDSLARIIYGVTGSLEDVDEYLRRLVFVVVIGNQDAHLKNWSFIFADQRRPRLSPAYDLVSTVAYEGLSPGLGLKLGGTKSFEDVQVDSFLRMARKMMVPEDRAEQVVRNTLQRINESASKFVPELSSAHRVALEKHMGKLPLLK